MSMQVVTLELEDGSTVLLPVWASDAEEDVGLNSLRIRIEELTAAIPPFVRELRSALGTLKPDETTVTLSAGIGWDGGKLVSIIGGPKADLGVQLSFTWKAEG
jgi:hypothetical protein